MAWKASGTFRYKLKTANSSQMRDSTSLGLSHFLCQDCDYARMGFAEIDIPATKSVAGCRTNLQGD